MKCKPLIFNFRREQQEEMNFIDLKLPIKFTEYVTY
jgi:hypothetical protein